jgi:hypothetical protein
VPASCSGELAAGIAAFHKLTSAGLLCGLASFDDTLAALCKSGATTVLPEALLPVDRKILCAVLCCCNLNPLIGSGDRNLRQSCVRETLDAADAMLGAQSRYKAEVSYNMRARPPVPLMDKDEDGNLTTRPLRFGDIGRMVGRINRDNPGMRPLGEKDIRRPDVVILKDPTRPPRQDNLTRVVEMKFPGDGFKDGQLLSYDAIDPTGTVMTLTVETCGCNRRRRTEEGIELIKGAEALQAAQPSTLKKVTYGVVTVAAAAATVAFFLFPGDGPAGEIAAGSATARAGAVAAGRVLLDEAARIAARQAAARSWGVIFGGAVPLMR